MWRALPADLPHWRTVYGYVRAWQASGATRRMHDTLRQQVRALGGRGPQPTAAVIDSQSVKAADTAGKTSRGYVASPSRAPASDLVVVLLPDSGRSCLSKVQDDWMRRWGFLDEPPDGTRTVADVLARRGPDGGRQAARLFVTVDGTATVDQALEAAGTAPGRARPAGTSGIRAGRGSRAA